jgi:hypothetical protein
MLGHCFYEIKMDDIGLALNVKTFTRFVKLSKLLFCRKEFRLVTYSGSIQFMCFFYSQNASNLYEFSVDGFPTPLAPCTH